MHLIDWHIPSVQSQKMTQKFGSNLEFLSFKHKMQLRLILVTYISHSLTLHDYTVFESLTYFRNVQADRTLREAIEILENIDIRDAEDFLEILQNLSLQSPLDKNDLNQNILKLPRLKKISKGFGLDLKKFDCKMSLRIACTAFLYCNNALKTEATFEDAWSECIACQPLDEELFCYGREDFLEFLEDFGINEAEIFLQWLQRESRHKHARYKPGRALINGKVRKI